jgi:hypothetical protein
MAAIQQRKARKAQHKLLITQGLTASRRRNHIFPAASPGKAPALDTCHLTIIWPYTVNRIVPKM